ncbi:PilN domain-containing protein [Undibacterium parvum]|uniref:MSHA biogenesis protein MshI n=1 Tax=Undibacterium parvum TaxID=401471 RepID=A0A3Q9BPJ5_9BURK|nr:PilN domain-containing protein [Undibacterium parvum]AZP11500.1 MSHA biogenesis protein MshI [Undibacterium parvum]
MSQQINLYNPIFLKTKKALSALALLQSFGLITLGSLGVALYVSLQASDLQRSADTVSAQLRAVETQVSVLRVQNSGQEKNPSLEAALAKTEAEIKAKQQITDVLQHRDFGNTQGYSSYMTAFARQIPSGLWLTGFTILGGGSEIALQGRTLKPELVALYVSQLKRESVMQGKGFSALKMELPIEIKASAADQLNPGKAKHLPAYLEFDLRSSFAQDKADLAGVKLK